MARPVPDDLARAREGADDRTAAVTLTSTSRSDRGAVSLRLAASAALLLAAIGGTSLAVQASAVVAGGSSGSVKIDGQDLDNATDTANDPKLDCEIPVEFQGFTQGQTFHATVTFEGQGADPDPVVSGGDTTPTFVGLGSGSPIGPIITYYVAGADHIKITVEVDDGYSKFKVFKVEDCDAPTFTVVKTNDADGDAGFTASETAPAAGAAVPFRARITNTSPYSIAVSSVTDAVAGAAGVPVTCVPAVTTILAGGFADCLFTLTGYAPPTGSKTNTVTVTAHQLGDTGNSTPVTSGVSTVTTPAVVPPSVSVVKTNDADGVAPYSVTETATTAGAAVPFKATITNSSAFPVDVSSIADAVESAAGVAVTCVPALTTIAAGGSQDCLFTLPAYAPATGSTSNVVTVIANQAGKPTNWTSSTSPASVVLAPTEVVASASPSPSASTTPPASPEASPEASATVSPSVEPSVEPSPELSPIGEVTSPDPATGPGASASPSAPVTGGGAQPGTGPGSLPFTGAPGEELLALGALLSVGGLLMVLAGRRRRTA